MKHTTKRLIADLLALYWLVLPVGVLFVVSIMYVAGNDPARCMGLQLKQQCYIPEYAITDQAREKGLSDRNNLGKNKVMVFVFDRPAQQCFWMKDMRFPLDMVFVDSSKIIKRIDSNVAPNTYPSSYCSDDTQFV